MATADFSFVTIFSRILANPLSVRMHYGHPDFFDAMWVHSRGALNKASPILNLNEDIFAGYIATLRNQRITHKEFVQAKKGRETSLRLADQFEAKVEIYLSLLFSCSLFLCSFFPLCFPFSPLSLPLFLSFSPPSPTLSLTHLV
jgi:hypothetical protein